MTKLPRNFFEAIENPDGSELGQPTSIRFSTGSLEKLDRIVAFANGKGATDVNRTSIIREALDAYLTYIEGNVPGI